MEKFKENFLKEYCELCEKHNLMLAPNAPSVMLIMNKDRWFDEYINETAEAEERYERDGY